MIETSKTFGVVSLKADSGSWRGEVGTTAEIFEYNDGEAEDGELGAGKKICGFEMLTGCNFQSLTHLAWFPWWGSRSRRGADKGSGWSPLGARY